MSNRISDGKPGFIAPYAHAVIAPLTLTALLADALSEYNYHGGEDVKRLGSVVMVTNSATGHALVMSSADLNTSVWKDLGGAVDITPVGAIPNVGGPVSDRKPNFGSLSAVLGSMDFPIYQNAEVLEANNYINSNTQGGKKLGAAIIIETATGTFKLFIAQGSAETDAWKAIDGTVLTPVGLAVTNPPHDRKPFVNSPQVSAVPFTVIPAADLASLTAAINAGDGVYNGKVHGSMVVADTGILYTAVGALPADNWVQLISADATAPIVPA